MNRFCVNRDNFSFKELLGLSLVHKYISGRLLRFADDKGIISTLASIGSFTLEDAIAILQRKCDYVLADKVRIRMVKVLIDFLCECGIAVNHNGHYSYSPAGDNRYELSMDQVVLAKDLFKGQVDFFDWCLDYAEEFLRGEPPLCGFDNSSATMWEAFLGNAEFDFARSVLAQLMFSKPGEKTCILDLCYGPGFDIAAIQNNSAGAVVTALDFKDVFKQQALGRAPDPASIRWVDAMNWKGFGNELPFSTGTFDCVFFACADPYINNEVRRFVYSDICRVIKAGGSLNILSHSYPDHGKEFVTDLWVRRGTLCHDFAESVCEGWNGFYDADKSLELFESVGFKIGAVMMNASIWRLDKP
ncbi:MAG TPA: class I SAM-dependent methyltransferase [Dissulfurispiraceae bacterium]|nr:class I SAM-dependent methyltransferase [Dissulfurispiraceae bacterium]